MGMQLLLLAFIGVSVVSLCLKWLNARHHAREGKRVPPELAGAVDAERLRKIADYTRERSRFGMVSELIRDAAFGVFLFGGLLGMYDALVTGLGASPLVSGVVFFVGLALGSAVLSIPFSLYS